MTVEDRLGDARLARDLGRRRTAIATTPEDPEGGIDDGRATLRGRKPWPLDAHPASEKATSARLGGASRSVSAAITAPSAIAAAVSSAWWKPFRKAVGSDVARRVGGRGDDRAHDRDAERAADLAHAVQHRRADTRLVGPHRLMAAAVIGAIAADIPTPPSSMPGRSAQKLASRAHAREEEERRREHGHPARDERPRPDPVGQAPGLRREEDDQHRPGQERRPRLDRRVAEHLLDVERDVEEDAEHRETDQQHDGVSARKAPVAEQRELEHRQPLVELEQDERAERDGGDGEGDEDPRRRPAVRVRLDQRVAEREEAQCGRHQPRNIRALLLRGVPRLVDEDEGREDPEHADRDVDVEDPVPVDPLGDDTADERADRERERGDAGPDPDRGASLPRRERRP